MLVALAFANAASAQTVYYINGWINGVSGGQAQIGDGLPLPIQPNRTTGMGPIGTKAMFPDKLLIPPKQGAITGNKVGPGATVKQTGSAPAQIKVPPGVFKRVPAGPLIVGVANNNPKVFQVRTKISFSGPAKGPGTMTFKKNAFRTGPVSFAGAPAGAIAFYSGSVNRFGGPSQTRVVPLSKIGVWVNPGAMLPCKHPAFGGANASCVAPLVPAYPMTLAAAGGGMTAGGKVTAGTTVTTPGGPPAMSPGIVVASIPKTTGLIAKSATALKTGTLTNMATSVGFPWTTGQLKLQGVAVLAAKETFTITGKDSRTAMGAGTISLVSGALSARKLSGSNANKSWARYALPEPGAALGAAAALTVLGICHGLVRRRSR
jgi:hypothetical protein